MGDEVMSIYVYGVMPKKGKMITWKCRDRLEARIVMSNIARSELCMNFDVFDISYSLDQPWVDKHFDIKDRQFITYESNKSYYYPWKDKETRI